MAGQADTQCSREQRWSLQGRTALGTGGTKGIGFNFNLCFIIVSFFMFSKFDIAKA